ncbi:hypothetical protein F5144DRAFT_482102 [Chaetomium tenue]|uniref:Uncharacterized protein n=1 Tax=Chaetomium tenue TaxID=1854479 RepID=A0ACB7PHN1_9PEZI|nr:hypothetical protein F5144DRAFT_482102 [Chaetomium globosum]
MDHFSTVLQRPPHFDEDGSNGAVGEDRGPRGGLRDILNPVSSTTQPGTPGAPAPPRPHSSFNLRSPTQQSDYHHPNTYAASPSAATGQSSGSRSILNNPFGSAASSSLPPPLQAPPNIVSAATSGLQHPPRSPLHAPTVYYPTEIRDRDQIREKSRTSSFYDPTTDGNRDRERRVSETGSWRSSAHASPPKARDPYNYSQSSTEYYNNGTYASPTTTAPYRPRSPTAHPRHSPAVGPTSPSIRPPAIASPSLRQIAMPGATTNGTSVLPALARTESPAPASKTPASGTPSRAAGVMSFSNILSSSEPVSKPRPTSPVPADDTVITVDKLERTDKEKKHHRKSMKTSRISDIRSIESTPKIPRRPAQPKADTPSSTRVPAKRSANGLPKHKVFSAEKEKKIRELMEQLDFEDVDATDFEDELHAWKERAQRRRQEMNRRDMTHRQARRNDYAQLEADKLQSHADFGKGRYYEINYDEALNEVREQELFAEKERKKDMQRKRRREKSMATTMDQRAAALARASAAQDEAERQKYMREAERANKKVQQTKYILQKGLKGPARNMGPIEPNLEGGTMATFSAENMEPGKTKGKGRSGGRLKKSKEQKQAEKESAEAAQAALDAGEELPSREETAKIRIKFSKSKGGKDDADKENKEPKDSKDKEKATEEPKDPLETRFQSKGFNQIYDQIWRDLARKDVNKVFRLATDSYSTKASNLKKTAILASKEAKRWQLRTNKGTKDLQARAKRVMRDMMGFWKRNEREERDLRKAAEKQELENARKEEADREAARQKRKLNFLISQTELYSHFIGKKIKTNEVERSTDHPDVAKDDKDKIPDQELDVEEPTGPVGSKVTNFENLDFDAEDESTLRAAAMANAQNAIAEAQKKARDFNKDDNNIDEDGEMNFQNPTGMGDVEIEQPKLLNCQLKEYQLKGLNWLVNLYEQGINGILADEMGLGKTVQSISVMAYLAEKYDIWGPFLVVAPASTLHNWQQEITRFVPEFKVLPYWACRLRCRILPKDEVAVHDFGRGAGHQELPKFPVEMPAGLPLPQQVASDGEWFSKDIESHAQSNTKLNEDQLKRLHMILKPFMLRRVKKHVQKELGDKIELDVFCDLTYRQRAMYSNLRNQISIMDLIEKATLGDDDSASLMNLVMQFRKVCNHPDLFERADTSSPFSCGYFAETASFVREGTNVSVGYSTRSLIEYELPRLVWRDGGRLNKAGPDNLTAGFRSRYLEQMMNIWTPENIQDSLGGTDNFTWLRFANTSPQEVYKASHQDVFARATDIATKKDRLGAMKVVYSEPEDRNWTPSHALFQICKREDRRPLAEITEEGVLGSLMNVARSTYDDLGLSRLEQAARSRATAPPIEVSCNSRGSVIEHENILFNPQMRKALYGPTPPEAKAFVTQKVPVEFYPTPALLPAPDNEKQKFTSITVPSMRRFVTDSGKLAKLDELLRQLKEGGHRVLLYFQMTRMIDMMEEYLTYRNYKYCRLDGSTKLEDRRDTVADFQTRPEIFIFLLSTRAGGLGINLTTADTVIFYDSDWNPTIDSQAMDRAHRLGQTKQVTVYRLITRGTIEERIRKRAMQKEEVQRVVITGGSSAAGGGVDFSGRRAPENRNRDIAMWLADDEQAELIERREKELLESGEYDKIQKKRSGGKRKRGGEAAATAAAASVSLDEMYHEGEGNFDDNKGSGTATPTGGGGDDGRGGKRKKMGSKKAKTTKQRLAIADGEI